ncbi:MAG: GGDEF domain-containing protein [Betaproteobacteria bacterium]|nr:GGDEF domain-containing protein [Betaproteobacteria bacterium]
MRFLRHLMLCTVLLLVAAGLALPAAAQAAGALSLDDRTATVDVWPAVSLLHDPEGKLGIDAVMSSTEFAVPQSAHAALGLQKKIMWLKVPLTVLPPSDGKWVLDIDYTLLNRIDVYVTADARVLRRAVLGNTLPFAERPIASRTHAVALDFEPGPRYELLLRIETAGSMILPITLSKPSAFHTRAINEQMIQGLLTSLGLCLLLYSLLQWVSLRETLYLKYAFLISGSVLFSVHFFGLGELYLWTDNIWLETHMAGLTSLLASCGTALFVEDVLQADMSPRLRRAMKVLAMVLACSALLHAIDVFNINHVSVVIGTLGLMPALMGVPGAIARVRRGDSVGLYFIVAWVGYFIASAIMVGVVKGHVGANFWTMHVFQIGATFDMLIFLRIAVLRSAAVHLAAQRATQERDSLISLAHTDPLTGLLNRRGLNDTLRASLMNSTRDRMLAVFVIDLDEFKPVNDQYGHDVGDELLMVVAQRLRATMRANDAVARVGGDEFVIMAAGLHSEAQARELGNKLLDALRTPFSLGTLGARTCRIGGTIGYALAPQDGMDAAQLLKTADAAMYAGKQAGKNALRRGAAVTA